MPSGVTTSMNASFSFSTEDTNSSFQCKLDSGPWIDCTSPKTYSALSLGSHLFSVRATDAAGNTAPTPATYAWLVEADTTLNCTQTLTAGEDVSDAVSAAASGAVICLSSGSYSVNVLNANKSSLVTVQPAPGASPTLGNSMLNKATNLRFQGLKFTDGINILGPAHHIQFIDNEFTGRFGIRANGQQQHNGTQVTDVLVDSNNIHDLDYTGTQGTADGYGIIAVNGVERFDIRRNIVKSVAADYIQSASPVDFTVDSNTFLGPSLMLPNHPSEHQDLWQAFGGGTNVIFTNNVIHETGTSESLLFQRGAFNNVVVENNLFDHDSRGYTCLIYQSTGLIFRNNTIDGSRWGCLFRDDPTRAPGSDYEVDHNIFAETSDGGDVSTEGRAGDWGTYDYNVSTDNSAVGAHSVRNWVASWSDTTNYIPLGLPFTVGYEAP